MVMMRPVALATVALIAATTLTVTAQQQAATKAAQTTTAKTVTRGAASKALPGTRPGVLSTIQGNALSASNGPLQNTSVRLRDARVGRIVDTQLTDQSGLFAFKAVEPGSYIVEIVGNDQSILAASQILNVNAGEAVSAIVKLPFRIPPFAGLLGNSTPSAAAVTTEAAASSVLATTIAVEPPTSQPLSITEAPLPQVPSVPTCALG